MLISGHDMASSENRKKVFPMQYKKPKIITCKDCKHYKYCRSRLCPCRNFKPIEVKEE